MQSGVVRVNVSPGRIPQQDGRQDSGTGLSHVGFLGFLVLVMTSHRLQALRPLIPSSFRRVNMALRYQDRPLLGDEDDQKEGVERWRRQTRLSVILDRLHASWPYAGWVALVVMAACQGFLAVKLSTVPPMAEPLGEINGLVPSCEVPSLVLFYAAALTEVLCVDGPRTIRFTTDYKQGLRAMNETELAWQDIMPGTLSHSNSARDFSDCPSTQWEVVLSRLSTRNSIPMHSHRPSRRTATMCIRSPCFTSCTASILC